MPVAVITGASQGLGLALAHALASTGWTVVADARDGVLLAEALAELPGGPHVAVPGDVADSWHRGALGTNRPKRRRTHGRSTLSGWEKRDAPRVPKRPSPHTLITRSISGMTSTVLQTSSP